MAIMRNGVFSNPGGKLGGVVFARWKTVDYGRAYSIPSNPNSANQQVQRNKMKDCVAWVKVLIYTTLNKFYDPFERDRSAFNTFVSKNIALFDGSPAYASIVLGEGSLYPAYFDGALSYDSGTLVVTASFLTASGYNGNATDKVALIVYDSTTNKFAYSTSDTARSTGENTRVRI